MKINRPNQECTRCVMDTSVSDIIFDENGVCNYCTKFIDRSRHVLNLRSDDRQVTLDQLIAEIKHAGKNKQYDCIVGLSGGVDSSWVLVNAVQLGLRPLTVHMDNGWNTELSQNNIANLVKYFGLDLYTHVIDWDEYRELMQSFFDADVVDVELLTDNAILAVNYQMAYKYGVKYILFGDNMATEGMDMPPGWNWLKFDKRNIKALVRRNNGMKLNTFPAIGTLRYFFHEYILGIKRVDFLDLVEYNKFDALLELEKKYGYKRYPYKHYESVFTRFYQGYLLPKKFGIDKRRLHLSTLIAAGQLSRDDALLQLASIPYPSERDMEEDIRYFLKKMGWSKNQLEAYIDRPGKSHTAYPSEKKLWELAKKMHKLIIRG